MGAKVRRRQSDWASAPSAPGVPKEALGLIVRRRRQMLIHCHLYYRLDEQLIDDHTWQRWADELVVLQRQHGTEIGFYDWTFRDWDASTGYHLPTDPDIQRVAARLLNQDQCKTNNARNSGAMTA